MCECVEELMEKMFERYLMRVNILSAVRTELTFKGVTTVFAGHQVEDWGT
jgi:hypothetical protein